MSGFNNISNNGKGRLPEDKLLAYLEGRLSPEEQHEVEALLADEGMEADALEGLQAIQPSEAKEIAAKLDHDLRKKLDAKPRRRSKPITENKWALLAVIIILLLCIAGYAVMHYMLKK